MAEFIKIMIILLLISAVSFLVGSKILKLLKLKGNFCFVLPIGFYVFLAAFQLLVYPAQFFHLSTKLLAGIILLLCFLSFAFCYKEVKEIKNIPWKKLLLVVILLVICTFVYVFSSNLEMVCDNQAWALQSGVDDIFFYTRVISVNADPAAYVNLTEPINGLAGSVGNLYAFTGILHLLSGLCMIFNVKALTLVIWFVFVFLRLLTFLNAFNVAGLVSGSKFVKMIAAISLIAGLFIGRGFSNGFEPVYFRGYTGIGFILLYALMMFYKTEKKNWLHLHVILMCAMMSCQSTQMFLGAVILTCAAVYDAMINHRIDVPVLSYEAIPVLIYIAAFLCYEKSLLLAVVLAMAVIAVNLLYKWKKKWFVWQIIPLIGIVSLIVMVIYGITSSTAVFDLTQSFENFGKYAGFEVLSNAEPISGSFDILNDLLLKAVPLITVYFIWKWKEVSFEIRFICVFYITMVILFYNPFVMPFVSTFMTGIVYSRIENVVLTSFLYFTYLSYFDKKVKWLGLFCLVSSLSCVAVFAIESVQIKNHAEEYMSKADLKYKIGNDVIEISDFIDDYFAEEDVTVLYPISLLNLRLYNERFVSSSLQPGWEEGKMQAYLSKYKDLSFNMQVQCMLQLPVDYFTNYFYEFNPEWVPDLKAILLESDADIVIMKKWTDPQGEDRFYHELLAEFTEILYDNEEYQIYRIYR